MSVVVDEIGAWRDRAACKGYPTDWWFEAEPILLGRPAPRKETGASHEAEAALDICRRCTVREECLEFAMATGQKDGMWGGKTEAQRRSLRKKRMHGTRGAE